jgi:hypothetical protein
MKKAPAISVVTKNGERGFLIFPVYKSAVPAFGGGAVPPGQTHHVVEPARADVLKGHGFSRAAQSRLESWPLGPEGRFSSSTLFPQGLKPDLLKPFPLARLKPCPFKSVPLRWCVCPGRAALQRIGLSIIE